MLQNNFAQYLVVQGISFYKQHKFKISAACFSSVLYKDTDVLRRRLCYIFVCLSLLKTLNFDGAMDYAAIGLTEFPNDDVLHFVVGITASHFRLYHIAVKHFKFCSNTAPFKDIVLLNLGLVYQEMRKLKSAIRCYNKFLIDNPKSEFIWYQLGICYINNRQHKIGIGCLYKSFEFTRDLSVLSVIAIMNLLQGNFKPAYLAFEKLNCLGSEELFSLANYLRQILCRICLGNYNIAVKLIKQHLVTSKMSTKHKSRLWNKLCTSLKCMIKIIKKERDLFGICGYSNDKNWEKALTKFGCFFDSNRYISRL